jgi:hypothetical protein
MTLHYPSRAGKALSPLAILLCIGLTSTFVASVVALPAAAAPAKKKKSAPKPTPKPEAQPEAPPIVHSPLVTPTPVAPAAVAPKPAPVAETPAPSAEAPAIASAPQHTGEVVSPWEGFFFTFGLGYSNTGGEAGPGIPNSTSPSGGTNLHSVANYDELVTTDVGAGPSVLLRFGYNILGYASFWLDIAGHGSLSTDKKDLAGGGSAGVGLAVHPLAFWRRDLPVDASLYAGWSPIEILGYNENQSEYPDYKPKGWIGTNIPFGLTFEWKPNIAKGFAVGLDLRGVNTTYDKWYFSWDREELSRPDTGIGTFRFEPRLTLAAHL